jgi:hypothetical protein
MKKWRFTERRFRLQNLGARLSAQAARKTTTARNFTQVGDSGILDTCFIERSVIPDNLERMRLSFPHYRCPTQEDMFLAAWRRTGRKFLRISILDVRAAWAPILTAAMTLDRPAKTGTASERNPISSS